MTRLMRSSSTRSLFLMASSGFDTRPGAMLSSRLIGSHVGKMGNSTGVGACFCLMSCASRVALHSQVLRVPHPSQGADI